MTFFLGNGDVIQSLKISPFNGYYLEPIDQL